MRSELDRDSDLSRWSAELQTMPIEFMRSRKPWRRSGGRSAASTPLSGSVPASPSAHTGSNGTPVGRDSNRGYWSAVRECKVQVHDKERDARLLGDYKKSRETANYTDSCTKL